MTTKQVAYIKLDSAQFGVLHALFKAGQSITREQYDALVKQHFGDKQGAIYNANCNMRRMGLLENRVGLTQAGRELVSAALLRAAIAKS